MSTGAGGQTGAGTWPPEPTGAQANRPTPLRERATGGTAGPDQESPKGDGTAGRRDDADGQASVELVLVLPLVVALLLGLLQAGLLLRDQLLVVQAAREGAREAAVSPQRERIKGAVRRAAPGLGNGLEVRVDRGARTGDLATVAVSALPTRVPTIGRVLDGHRVEASATMRVERTGP